MEIDNKIMNVILYTRVSTQEQVKGFSLSSQEKICKEYAERQNWNVVEVFQEQGESAKTADRTQLLKLLEYCIKNRGKVDAVIAYKLDRVARNAADYQGIRAALSKCGVVLRFATETVNETSQGKFMENIFAAIAQLDNDVRAERTKAGLKERVNQGLWAWAPPMGYKSNPGGMIVDQEKSTYIKQAFELYSTGAYTLKDIARKFNKWGIRTKRGNKISPQFVTNMLENKLYIGLIEVKNWENVVEGVHEPIITPELFYKAERVRQGKSVSNAPRMVNNPEFPLRGIAKCSSCSRYLTGSYSSGRSQKYAYYHCICGETRVRKEILEELFLNYLKKVQPNEVFAKLFHEILVDVWKLKQRAVIVDLQKIDKELAHLKNIKSILIDKNLNGVISDNDLREQSSIIQSKITIREVERSETRLEETNIDYLVSISEELLSKVSTVWLDAPFEHKLKFQQLLFPKGINYVDGNIGTEELGLPFKLIVNADMEKTTLVSRTGVEPVTDSLRGNCSTS